MGKRIRVQRRGRGGSTYRASTHKRVAPAKYPFKITPKDTFGTSIDGEIVNLVHDPGRGSPLAFVKFTNGESCHTITPEGLFKGQQISIGGMASPEIGNILPLGKVPEGSIVCNLELRPGDGGKMARSSGAYATVVGHTPQGTLIKLPSGRTRYLHNFFMPTISGMIIASRTCVFTIIVRPCFNTSLALRVFSRRILCSGVNPL